MKIPYVVISSLLPLMLYFFCSISYSFFFFCLQLIVLLEELQILLSTTPLASATASLSFQHIINNNPTSPSLVLVEDEVIGCLLNLMRFLRKHERLENFVKYVHLLCDVHLAVGNYTEAGMTLLLHADLLPWSDNGTNNDDTTTVLSSSLSSGPLSVAAASVLSQAFGAKGLKGGLFEQKEDLIQSAIQFLDKGKSWEKAIGLIRQLRYQYEAVQFNYQKLAEILVRK